MAKNRTGHISWYINIGQTLGIAAAAYLGARFLKLEEHKAGMQRRSLKDVVLDDVAAVREKWYDFRYRQYRHY